MAEDASLIIYDGQCIFCQNYVRLVRLREAVGAVELIDARSDDPRVDEYWTQGYDLNRGMLFIHRGRVHHGADALNAIAVLSTDSSTLNRMNGWLFSRPLVAKWAYPLLRIGRGVTLMALGRSPLLKRK